VKQKTKNVILK